MKTRSLLYNQQYIKQIKDNANKYDWAAKKIKDAIETARPWLELSDDTLWSLMFGNTIPRSHMVWSNGCCPACGKSVPMYDWKIDAWKYPWKVCCPHCGELFPKNDFGAYYQSGLDDSNIFRYELADETLLTCDDTPGDCNSPYKYGIDDGMGNSAKNGIERWYFVGHYLQNGLWEQQIVSGCINLATAYLYTGEAVYAHKSAILLDRIADLFPTFDFRRQGYSYEKHAFNGYVTTCMVTNGDITAFAFAYDIIFDCIRTDSSLVDFLHHKSQQYKVTHSKNSFADIQANIETRIFEDAIAHSSIAVPKPASLSKIWLNPPMEHVLLLLIYYILDREESSEKVKMLTDLIFKNSLAFDGTTGERGMGNGYANADAMSTLAFVELLVNIDEKWIGYALEAGIEKTFHFETDYWFSDRFYPSIGDGGSFGNKDEFFPGAFIGFNGRDYPGYNLYTLLWKFYRYTKDEYYLHIIYRKIKEYPLICDIVMSDIDLLYDKLKNVCLDVSFCDKSVKMDRWRLAAIRGNEYNGNGRALWLHYEAKAHNHDHSDVMNMGLYGFGINLMPENGYPPVQYGGFLCTQALWYSQLPYMHNLVTVDRMDMHPLLPGNDVDMTTWYDGENYISQLENWEIADDHKTVTASANGFMELDIYRRTLWLQDIDEKSSIVIDVFDVSGGKEHLYCAHSGVGTAALSGAAHDQTLAFTENVLLRNIFGGKAANDGFTIDWQLEDTVQPENPRDIRMRGFGLTKNCEVYHSEMWVSIRDKVTGSDDTWVPMFLTRRTEETKLASRFVNVYIPSLGECPVRTVSYDGDTITLTLDAKTLRYTISESGRVSQQH